MSRSGAEGRVGAGSVAFNNSDSDGVRGGGEGNVEGLPSSVREGGGASPPLVILSSRFKHASSLSKISNPGVVVVYYKYENTTLEGLLAQVGKSLQGGQALSIALLMHGHTGYFKINKEKSVTAVKLREDKEVRQFFSSLVESHLDRDSPLARVDLLQSSLLHGSEGARTLQELRDLLKVSVHASPDMLGGEVSVPGSRSSVRIGTLYFDGEKLRDWMVHSGKESLALYEKMWIEGVGAYGRAIVYRRRDDNSFVILKEINMMELTKQQRVLALNEVEVLSRLDHPNIISFYDSFEEDGTLMIEMEYAEKGTLAKYLSSLEHPLGEKEILSMFAQMAAAIEYLHSHKILHRDLKTANIFLTKEGMVKLGDFGISKILSHTDQQAQTVLGTPYYISPEICESRPYDTKSDIWALGCILYEMACGRRTFEGTNLGALVNKIMSGTFDPVTGNFRPEFCQLITDMLQVHPDRRPSAVDLVMVRLPPLMEQLVREEEEEEEPEANADERVQDSDASRRTRSFTYLLDHETNKLRPVDFPVKVKLEQVAVGFSHFLALSEDCSVFSWGENTHGQLGMGDVSSRGKPQPIESLKGSKICKVECGGEFSVFVSDKGIILTCGRGSRGALGHADSWEDVLTPKLITSLFSESVADVACGEGHVVAMTADNGLLSWGTGGFGRLGNGSEEDQNSPRPIPLSETVAAVKCGVDGTLFLTTSGRLLACGSNQYNKLGLNDRVTFRMQLKKLVSHVKTSVSYKMVPTPIRELREYRAVDMAMGPTHTAVLVSSGRVFTFGRNMEGQLGTGHVTISSMVTKTEALQGKAMAVVCGEVSTVAVSENNNDINNCFLLWGSPPVTTTPLTSLLKQAAVKAVPNGNHDNKPDAVKPKEGDSGVTQRGKFLVGAKDPPPLLSPILPNELSLSDSFKSELSNGGHLASAETTPERMLSDKSTAPLVRDSSQYLLSLLELLPDPPPSAPADKKAPSRMKNRKNSQIAAPDVVANGNANCTAKVVKFAAADGTVVDFNALGWRRIKLGQLASFGPNLVVLIEAVVPESPEHSSIGALRGASFRVKPELRRFSRLTPDFYFDPLGLRCSRPQTPLSQGPTPQTSCQVNEKKNIIVSMVDYTAGSSTDESKIPSWLVKDLEDARRNPTSPLSPASPLSPGPVPLGLPVIVGQGPLSNSPLAAILMRPAQQRPQTLQQPSLRSPRHRSVSNETVLVTHPKPHPQQPKDSSGSCTHGVRRCPSENVLTTKRDVGAGPQFERVQRREAKGTQPNGSPNRLLATPSYRGNEGGASGSPQGIGKGEPPATGQLRLPSIVNSSHQADPVLLGNQRSKSSSQIMSPTFIKKLTSGGGQPKKAAVGAHGLFPRRQSFPIRVEGRLPIARQLTSDSATTDDEVAMATPTHAWQASQSSATTTSEEEEKEEPAGGVESGLGSGREPIPSSSSDEVFDNCSYHNRLGGVAKSKAVVVRRPESGRSQPPRPAKTAAPSKRSPYLSRLSKQPHNRGGLAKPHKSTPAKPVKEDRTASLEQMKAELEDVMRRQQDYEEKLLQAQHSSERDKAELRAEVDRLQQERDQATALLREEREQATALLREEREQAAQPEPQEEELREEIKALKAQMSKYKCMIDKLHSQMTSREHHEQLGEEPLSASGVADSLTGVATEVHVEVNSTPPPEEGGIPKVTVPEPFPKKKKRVSSGALLGRGWSRKSTPSGRADSTQEATQSQFCTVM